MPSEHQARARITVIDDDLAFLDLMKELLSESNEYDVVTCVESDEAYPFIKQQQPDLIILDLVMHREERGWQTLELLRLDPATERIPVILCSAAAGSLEENAPLLERYHVETLSKPFNLDDVLSKIQETLAQHPPRSILLQ